MGTLAHASKVVRSSRVFLRRLIDLSTIAKRPQHFIRLNGAAKSDIEWWYQFIYQWNGISALRPSVETKHILVTDASGNWGCGAYWGQEWFQLKWSGMLSEAHISVKELTPVVLAVALWGRRWSHGGVRVLSDNTATVAAINNQTSRIDQSAHLLRCLAFFSAHFQCVISAEYLPGRHNTLADALSRNNLQLFRSLSPQAHQSPTPIPAALLHLLIVEQPDWTSRSWTKLWGSTLMLD